MILPAARQWVMSRFLLEIEMIHLIIFLPLVSYWME